MGDSHLHQAPDAERAVLGAILLDADLIWHARAQLAADDFGAPSHAAVFGAMSAIADRRERPEIVPLTEAMRTAGTLDRIGGAAYLSRLADDAVTAAGLDGAVRAVRDASLLRQVERFGQTVAATARGNVADVAAFVADVEARALARISH